ncbi:MAG: sugar nucleotide-binding protein [Candidatus Omnitrophota bacterium]|jgi:dTDP-4-dehydrorhamnose reductase
MKNKILVLGQGFIGTKIQREFGCDISGKRIHSYQDAEKEIRRFNPKIIINCIGITGKNNVDDCELVKDKTLTANSFIPLLLAEAAIRRNIKFIHISSGCIFHYDYKKDKPIKEDLIPNFFDLFYSRTKIYAEQPLNILSKKNDILIPRIRIPLDNQPSPKNILTKLLKYTKIIDAPNSVTYVPDFIKALNHLIKIDARGIYNVVNKGGLRYPELLEVYKKFNPDFKYNIIKIKDLKLVRTNLLLSCSKLEKSGFKVRNISEVLEECVEAYLNS